MAQETPLIAKPDDPIDVGRAPRFNGSTLGWESFSRPLSTPILRQPGTVLVSDTLGQRIYNVCPGPWILATVEASLGVAASSGSTVVEVYKDGVLAATLTLAAGATSTIVTYVTTVPNGSHLRARVTQVGVGAADLAVQINGVQVVQDGLYTAAQTLPWALYDAEAGQPKGVGYVQLNGVSGDYISTPDSPLLDVTGDIEIVARVRLNNWATPTPTPWFANKNGATTAGGYGFRAMNSGVLQLNWSTGAAALSISSAAHGFTSGVTYWVKATLDVDNGASGNTVTFYWAADQANEPTAWTQIGSPVVTAGVSSIGANTLPLALGTWYSGTGGELDGRLYRVIVRNGIGGAVVADFNADDCYGDGYWHTGGYRWTLGLPKIYDRGPNGLAPATFGAGSNQPLWLPWDGKSSVYLPGTAGNAISAPHAASHDITGDIEIVANLNLGSVTVAQRIVSRGTTSWAVFISASNTLGLAFRFGGSMAYGAAALGANINVPLWVKVTRSASSGLVSFYSAPDSQNEPTSWSLLGTSTPTAPGAMDPITTSIFLGGYATSGENLIGGIRKVVVRDGFGGSPVVDFDASLCTQTGYTDSRGNVWTMNRSTSGRKAVVQSPVAGSARSVILFGADDYIDVPAAAIPALDTFAAPSAVAASCRRWHNPGASSHAIFATKAANSSSALGLAIRPNPVAASTQVTAIVGDGATQDFVDLTGADTVNFGARGVVTATVGNVSPFVAAQVNGGARSTDTGRATTVTTSTGGAGRIGAYLGGSSAIDMEFEALATYRRDVGANIHAALVAGYNGGQ